ncbi:hypothetical protein PoB_005946900 [Plakobranchus ocellatus]|uniref:Uncharacterized protein n=1 Tax=Plakobranchus ocellatus TaxID=259542 RepID=A0AAV4CN28_9GAST|nr:hypothetical protein PoB_005946900 [Plakobranchus ocellatus]
MCTALLCSQSQSIYDTLKACRYAELVIAFVAQQYGYRSGGLSWRAVGYQVRGPRPYDVKQVGNTDVVSLHVFIPLDGAQLMDNHRRNIGLSSSHEQSRPLAEMKSPRP